MFCSILERIEEAILSIPVPPEVCFPTLSYSYLVNYPGKIRRHARIESSAFCVSQKQGAGTLGEDLPGLALVFHDH